MKAVEGSVVPAPLNYVTFLDALYLPQALALHDSLIHQGDRFRLFVYAMDEAAFSVLSALDLPHVSVRDGWSRVAPHMTRVRNVRNGASLLWTATPFVIRDQLGQMAHGDVLIYVDADMAILKSVRPALTDFYNSEADVYITPHNFAADYDAANFVGEFAVQFLAVRNGLADEILDQWANQCLESCPATPTDGIFGDQKYLDDWPIQYGNRVQIAPDPEWFQGPWNASRFPASRALAYHFHGLRLTHRRKVLLTTHYRIPQPTLDLLYVPYVETLGRAVSLLSSVGWEALPQTDPWSLARRGRFLAGRIRRVWGQGGGPRTVALPRST